MNQPINQPSSKSFLQAITLKAVTLLSLLFFLNAGYADAYHPLESDFSCNNITNPGEIGTGGFGCGEYDVPELTNLEDPSGGSGDLEIIWITRPGTSGTWQTVTGANGLSYDPGVITQTTQFRRCSRRSECTQYIGESNIITVEVYPALELSCNCTAASGWDATDGSVGAVVNGGTAPFTYDWGNGPTSMASLYNLSAGVYPVSVTDANGCTASTECCVQQPPAPEFCIGFRTQTQGGWGSNPNGGNNGAYLHTNFNAAFPSGITIGCDNSYTFTTAQAITNFLPCGGTASSLPSGNEINPSCPSNVFVSQVLAISISLGFDTAIPDFSTNSIPLGNLLVSSGPFTGWTVSELIDEANSKLGGCPSDYSFSQLNDAVTSVNENFVDGGVTGSFLDCCIVEATCETTNGDCNNENLGSITAVPSGGTAPFTYLWSNDETTETISGLVAGTYSVTITDANGCTATCETEVTDVECCNVTDGGLIGGGLENCGPIDPDAFTSESLPSGGLGDLEYIWLSSPVFVQNFVNNDDWTEITGSNAPTYDPGLISETTYFIRCARRDGCTFFAGESNIIGVIINPVPSIALEATNGDCDNDNLGSINATVTNGSGALTYVWTDEDDNVVGNTASISGLAAGTYTLVVTDENDCSDTDQATIAVEPCCNVTDGGLIGGGLENCGPINPDAFTSESLPSGGLGDLEYIWLSNPENEPNIVGNTNWVEIPGSTSPTYDPGLISETTFFIRCSRSVGCDLFLGESNVIGVIINPVPSIALEATNGDCDNDNLGSINATVTNGSGTLTYVWTDEDDNVVGNTASISGLAAGIYTLVVTDENDCSDTDQATIAVEPCCNVTDGGLIGGGLENCGPIDPDAFTSESLPSGGIGDLEYVWLSSPVFVQNFVNNDNWTEIDGSNSPTYDPGLISETTYFIRCARRDGCTFFAGESNIIGVIINPVPSIALEAINGDCDNDNLGSINATVTNGSGALTYVWTDEDDNVVGNAASISGLAAGTYTLVVTDDNDCSDTDQATIAVEPCCNVTNGGLIGGGLENCGPIDPDAFTSESLPSGGLGDLEYIWLSSPVFVQNFVNNDNWTEIDGSNSPTYDPGLISETTYFIRCARRDGCTFFAGESNIIGVIINPVPSIALEAINGDCDNDNLGSINATVTNGSGTLTYVWTDEDDNVVGNTASISGLAAGTYTLVVTDENDCSDTDQATIAVEPCCNVTDGGLIGGGLENCGPIDPDAFTSESLPSGGLGDLEYIWLSSPVFVQNFVNNDDWTEITGSNAPTYDPGLISETTYFIRCARRDGCTFFAGESNIIGVIINPVPSIALEAINGDCDNDNLGSINATVTNGSGALTYVWTDEDDNVVGNTASISGLAAGTYTLVVTDENDCSDTDQATIAVEPCCNVTNGGLIGGGLENCGPIDPDAFTSESLPSGGLGDLEYVWLSSPVFVQNFVNNDNWTEIDGSNSPTYDPGLISETTYFIRCARRDGCTFFAGESNIIGVIINPVPSIALEAINGDCDNDNLGSINATVTNGSGALTYVWTDEDDNVVGNTASISGLAAGTYTLVVTDENDCSDTDQATIAVEPCCNVTNGGLIGGGLENCGPIDPDAFTSESLPSGGLGDLEYVWLSSPVFVQNFVNNDNWTEIDGSNSPTYDPGLISETTYFIRCARRDGCTFFAGESNIIGVIINPIPTVLCSSTNEVCGQPGSVSVLASDGTAPYTYQWTDANDLVVGTDASVTGLAAGTYSVLVTDANDCTATCDATVAEQPDLSASCSSTDALCGTLGSLTATPTGGTAPYSYQWSNGATTAMVSDVPGGSYSVTVTDANGCTAECSTTVESSVEPLVDVFCEDDLLLVSNGGGTQDVLNTDFCVGPYAFWSGNLVSTYTGQKHWLVTNGSFTEGPAGTAQLTATYTNRDDNTLVFDASITFSGRTFTPPAGSPKENSVCVDDIDNTDWYYYTETQGVLVGQNALAGAVVNISRFGEAFQVGTGANLNGEFEYGASGWLDFEIVSQPSSGAGLNPNSNHLDINFKLEGGPNLFEVPDCTTICEGEEVTLVASALAGDGSYTYLWSPGGQTTASITVAPASSTTYTVTVMSDGCEASASIDITVNDVPEVSCDVTNGDCSNENLGSITAVASGGTAPFTYLWSNDETTETISGLIAGTYSVTITDANGCTATCETEVTDVECCNVTDGGLIAGGDDNCGPIDPDAFTSVSLPSGGLGAIEYLWLQSPVNEPNIVGNPNWMPITGTNSPTYDPGLISETTFFIRCSRSAGCEFYPGESNIIGVIINPIPTVLCSSTNEVCGQPGSVSVLASDGTAPYTYQWTDANDLVVGTDASVTGLAAGTYSVLVTDANDCTATCDATVAEQPDLSASCSSTDALCGTLGSLTATPTGGTAPYSYQWSNGATTAMVSDVPGGSYSVTVTDANGCTAECSTTVESSLEPLVDVFCEDDLLLVSNGGGTQDVLNTDFCVGPYAFWSGNLVSTYTGQKHWLVTNGSFTEGPAGTAQLTATYTNRDDNTLVFDASITFSGRTFTPPAGSPKENSVCVDDIDNTDWYYYTETQGVLVGQNALAGAVVNISRFGEAFQVGTGANLNGEFEYGASGWLDFEIVSQPSSGAGLNPNSNHLDINFKLEGGPNLFEVPDCTTICEGEEVTLVASALAGDGSYTYLWSPGGQTTASITVAPASSTTYTVTVMSDGCEASASIDITVNDAPMASCSSTPGLCGELGSASVDVTGGSAPYTYEWTNEADEIVGTEASLDDLVAGTYSVLVTDAKGCTDECSIEVSAQPALSADCIGEDGLCGELGSASVTPVGGMAPYTYLWNNGATSATISGLEAGTYSVTVADANGCLADCEVTISTEPALSIDCTSTNGECGEGGSASVSISSGTAPYSYLWSNGATTESITGLGTGTYMVTVTDGNGCVQTCSTDVSVPSTLDLECSSNNGDCEGAGSASVNVEGGTLPYSYLWSNGETSASISGLGTGSYSVTVTDAQDCSAMCSVEITTPIPPIVDIFCEDDLLLVTNGGGTQLVENTTNCNNGPYAFWSNTLVNAYTTEKQWTITGGSYIEGPDGTAQLVGTYTNNSNSDLVFDASFTFSGRTFVPPAGSPKESAVCVGDIDNTDWYYYTETQGVLVGQNALAGAVVNISRFGEAFQVGTGANLNVENEYGASGWLDFEIVSQPSSGAGLNPNSNHLDINFKLEGGPNLFEVPDCTTICEGEEVTLVASALAGDGSYTYLWSPGGQNTASITVAPASSTTYTVTVMSDGCEAYASIDITVNDAPMASCSSTPGLCGELGSASVDVTGGTAPYTYEWSNGGTTASISGLTAGTYSVLVTDANGCTDECSIEVLVTSPDPVSFTAPADLCIDAGVQAGLGGGLPTGGVYSGSGVTDDGNGMTYSFDPAIAGAGATSITYSYTDANDCPGSVSDDVDVFGLPVVTFTAPADLCIDAGVQAGLGGGSPTGGVYSGTGVTDDGNGMTFSFDPAIAGAGTASITYSYTDANNCPGSASDDVEVFDLPVVTFTAPADLCVDAGVQAGLGGGSPTGGVYSGTGITDDGNGMTYTFDPAVAGIGLSSITYSFSDENGCSGSASDDTEVFGLPVISCSSTDGLCGETASASVEVISGNSPYTYLWNTGATTADISGLAAGTYSVTVTDANGCAASCEVDVAASVEPLVDVFCEDDLLLVTNGGGTQDVLNTDFCVGPYAFWSGNLVSTYTGQKHWLVTNGSFTEGPAGTAQLTATYTNRDDNTLVFDASITFSGRTFTPPAGSPKENSVCVDDIDNTDWYYYTETQGVLVGQNALAGAVVNISRFGEAFQVGTGANLNGEFEYGASGWLDFEIVSQPSSGAGLNPNSNHLDINFKLEGGPNLFEVPDCTTICAGEEVTLVASALAGDGSYTYQWSPGGQTTASITVAPASSTTYTVTVMSDGCEASASIDITVNDAPMASCSSTPGLCGELGSASVDVTGGSAPYTYEWTNEADEIVGTEASLDDLVAGTYSVLVTDAKGCTDECSIEVSAQPALSADCIGEDGLCGELGSASVTPVGGMAPYTYLWNNGATSATISGLEAGTYSVTVADANGCSTQCSTTIITTANPEVEIVCEADLLLLETNNGIADNTLNCNEGLYAFWANNLLSNYTSEKHWTVTDGLFSENEDGTAELVGTYTNKDDNTLVFEASFTFSGRTYIAPPGSPKENSVCVGDIDNSDWYYYTETEGTLIGQNGLDGAVVNVSRMGESFQVGTGANLNQEFEYGASGWLNYEIVSEPNEGPGFNTNSGHLDINFSLPEGPNTFTVDPCTELCSGDSRTLVALASAGDGEYEYLWSTGETTQFITVTPDETTTYMVDVTSDGCTIVGSIELVVGPCFDCEDEQANIGDSCDDNDPTTMDDSINADCECVGVPTECTGIGDADMDGVCADIDCDDNDPNNTFTDADNDGFCSNEDCDDQNPNVFPGAEEICDGIDNNCADGIDEGVLITFYADADGDGFGDPNVSTEACTAPDGFVEDDSDLCPNDGDKSDPGVCGCGVAETDSDGDGTADCIDSCPEDPNKILPGDCGCGVADLDSDSDGTPDCNDACPEDPNKIEPGICGCGVSDADSDGDGVADCDDECPLDPDKVEAGICGCGVSDADSDGDGTPDCIDGCPENASLVAPLTWYADMDGDGFGDANHPLDACTQPDGFVGNDSDCNDNDGNLTVEGASCDDGDVTTINDVVTADCGCEGVPTECTGIGDADMDGVCANIDCDDNDPNNTFTDADNDGFCSNEDCDDQNPNVFPGAEEICDGIDNNCADGIDEGVLITFYADADGDGFGDPNVSTEACTAPDGFVEDDSDLCPNDGDKSDPGVCGCGVAETDSDGDGTADCIDSCPDDPNKILPGDCGCGVADLDSDSDGTADCNDACPEDPNKIEPGICGCGVSDADSDGDGVADCDDECPLDPDKVEAGICGCGVSDADSDGDGTPDCIDGCPENASLVAPLTWYADMDGDGFGDANHPLDACTQPDGFVGNDSDCNDNDGNLTVEGASCDDGDVTTINDVVTADCGCEGVPTECTGIGDADMDGVCANIDCDDNDPDNIFTDVDGDGYCSDVDCDDNDASLNLDDADGDGFSTCEGDCDDQNPLVNPGAIEVCDGLDNDCDGFTDDDDADTLGQGETWFADNDGDSYGDPDDSVIACNQPDGYVDNDLDCNDGDPTINPDATEICDGIDNNCDGDVDEGLLNTYYADADGDGFGDPDVSTQACSAPDGFVEDDSDLCPNDGEKSDPGVCGCDVSDLDSDSDGTPDCIDDCPSDPNKILPGDCGCGVSDVDSDSDGTADCLDGCPEDPNKVDPGTCGCGVSDVDSDGDGTPDCNDGCPDNASLLEPLTWYADMDGDGFGDANHPVDDCTQPAGFVGNDSDCNDNDSNLTVEGADCVDGDDNTINDVVTTDCECVGELITPENDLVCDAEEVSCLSETPGTTVGATFDGVETCGTSNTAPGVWYFFDAPFNGSTVASLCDAASFDTKISIFQADACDAELVCVAGNDDGTGCSGFTSEVAFDFSAGNRYYILVHGFSSQVGTFTLSISECEQIFCESPDLSLIATADEAGLEPIEGCIDVDAQFFVQATVANGSGNSAYNATVNGVASVIDAEGTFTFGPFDQGTNVSITLTGAGDSECEASGSLNSPELCPPPAPENDLVCDAEEVSCLSETPGTTVGATFDGVETCGTSNTAPGVWYFFDAPFNGSTVASLCDAASFDTKISIFQADACDAELVCVAGNDDGAGCSGFTSEVAFDFSAGNRYYILVHGFSSQVGTFTLSISECEQIFCESPDLSLIATADEAGLEPIEGCIDVDAQFFVQATVANGSGNSAYNATVNGVASVIDAEGTFTFGPFDQGTNVSITLTGAGDSECEASGSLNSPELCPPPAPENDLVCDAEEVSCLSETPGTTVGATFDGVETCGTSNTAPGVWYFFDAPFNGSTVASLCDAASFDTKISIFQADACDAELVCVAGNDDGAGCSGFTSEVAFDFSAGNRYYILVHGFSSQVGTFTLSISECEEVLCASPELSLTLSSDQEGLEPVGDCIAADGQFWVQTTVAGGFGNTGYNATVNGVTSVIGAEGTFAFGPYDQGINVSVSIVGVEVDGCSNEASINSPEECPEPCEANEFNLFIDLDSFGSETSWELADSDGNIVASNDGTLGGQTEVSENLCLADGCYDLSIFDSFSDGIFGTDDFSLTDADGNIIASGEVEGDGGLVAEFSAGGVICTDPPVAATQNIIIPLDENGQATITPEDVDNGSSSPYPGLVLQVDIDAFDCSNLGDNEITLTAVDMYGNESSSEAMVTVIDEFAPTVVTQNTTVYLDESGQVAITLIDVDGGCSDNCDLDTYSLSTESFDCSDLGVQEVILTVTDASGNSASASSLVTVVDGTAPEVLTQNIEITLDENGSAEITANDVDNGSNDPCGIASMEITSGPVEFDCSMEGQTFDVELTVTDVNGNSEVSMASVTVGLSGDIDLDGIGDACDFCFGDNSSGDTNGDGICDSEDEESIMSVNIETDELCLPRSYTVEFYLPGSSELIAEFEGSIGADGMVYISGNLEEGNYDIYVKVESFLSKGIYDYTIGSDGANSMVVSNLKIGDVNGDDMINFLDGSALNPHFGSSVGDPNYSRNADLNCDGAVNFLDGSALNIYYGESGERP